MGSCTRINIVYSLSSLSESFSCWFISVLFFFFSGEEGQYEASLMKVDDHWSFLWIYGGLLWGNIVNKCKSRSKLKTLWKIQGRRCWNIYGKDNHSGGFEIVELLLFSWARGTIKSAESLPGCLEINLAWLASRGGWSQSFNRRNRGSLGGEFPGKWRHGKFLSLAAAHLQACRALCLLLTNLLRQIPCPRCWLMRMAESWYCGI